MGTSSAIPANLESFVTRAGASTESMDKQLSALNSQIDEYESLPSDYKFTNGSAIGKDALDFVNANREDERFVEGVRQAFVHADATTLSDGVISSTLKKEGVSTSPREMKTIPQPEFRGKPLDSGFSDDPVCTATGHFLEEETDLVVPDTLRVLGCLRTYSSLLLAPTSLGRGWYGWADARLAETDTGVEYTGPDGQAATFTTTDDGTIGSHPAVAATVRRRDEGGLTLRWRWASPRPGMVWDFAPGGALLAIHDPEGGTTACGHDEAGHLVSLEHAGGRRIDITWAGERIMELESSDGRCVRYLYDGPDLVGVTRPSGAQRYTVDDSGRILEIHDADGVRLMANTYDEEGRIQTQTSPFGRTSHYRYLAPLTAVVNDDDGGPSSLYRHDLGGRLVELVNADGRRAHRSFDGRGNPVRVEDFDGSTTNRSFDDDGNCTYLRRPDGTAESWTYDDEGRVLVHVDGGGAATTRTYGEGPWPLTVEDALGGRTTYVYRDGLLLRVVDPDGVGTTYERNSDGVVIAVRDDLNHILRITPGPSGHPVAVELPTGERWSYELDGAGRLLAAVSPGGRRFTWRWTPAGRPLSATAPDGAETTYAYGAHGGLDAVTAPGGRVTAGTWDRLGSLRTLALPGEDPWHLDYDGVMALVGVTSPTGAAWELHHGAGGASEGFTDAQGHRWLAEHDQEGRTTGAVSPLGRRLEVEWSAAGRPVSTTNDAGSRTSVAYDECGRPLAIEVDGRPALRWAWTPAGRPLAATLPDGRAWRWRYDAAGRAVETIDPEGGVTSVERDAAGRVTAVVDGAGVRSEQRRDADGRVLAVASGPATIAVERDDAGRIVALTRPGLGVTSFGYDDAGRLAAVVDALGATTNLSWSADGRALELLDALGGRQVRTFDTAGRVVTRRDPLGRTTVVERDGLGRPAALGRPDGTRLEWRWDADGFVTAITGDRPLLVTEVEGDPVGGAARRQRTTGPDGEDLVIGWDRTGRPVESTTGDRRTTFAYDDDGRTVSVELPAGPAGRWHLDALGQPSVLDHPMLGPVTLLRDGAGQLIGVEADGLSRRWQRDGSGQIIGYQELIDDVLRLVEVERDASGRVVAETVPGGIRRYLYDGAGQLVGTEEPGRSARWTYDAVGRLVGETVTRPGSGPHRRTYAYDLADQVTEVDDDGVVTVFEYDRLGRRVAERGPDRSTRYTWDELGRLAGIEHLDAHGSRFVDVRTDAFGRLAGVGPVPVDWPGGPIGDAAAAIGGVAVAGLPGVPVAAGSAWISTDWRGTAGPARDPWGAPLELAGPGPAVGFLGEVCFEGLVWLRDRVYDPATRAFLSPDPETGLAGYPGALTNPYTYAGNDPVGLVDPAGHTPLSLAQAQSQIRSWRSGHWGQLLVGGLAIAGAVGLTVLTDGAAAPLIYSAVAGGAFGAGSTAVTELLEHKPLDGWSIFENAGIGAFLGAAGTDTAVLNDSGVATKAIPALLSKLPGPGPIPDILTGTGVGLISSASTNNFATDKTSIEDDLIGGGLGGVGGGVTHYITLPNSIVAGVRPIAGKTINQSIETWEDTNPAKWWGAMSNITKFHTLATTPFQSTIAPFSNLGTDSVPTPHPPAAPGPGVERTTSAGALHHYLKVHGHR